MTTAFGPPPPLAVATLGWPRIGPKREMKTALEAFWAGELSEERLLATAAELRAANWARQRALGAHLLPAGDFTLYDHVLDTAAMVGTVPPEYGPAQGAVGLATYFAMARGTRGRAGGDLPALEMTKWFDTNYHYIVPELSPTQEFALGSTAVVDQTAEAIAQGHRPRPLLLGPVTFLMLAKARGGAFDPLDLLPGLLPVYAEVLRRLAALGVDAVQMDEPALVLDLSDRQRAAFRTAYETLGRDQPGLSLMLTAWFGPLGDNLDLALSLPVQGLHLDLVRGPGQLEEVLGRWPQGRRLSLGVVDGRNVWRADLASLVDRLEPVVEQLGAERLELAPSCSLIHVPIDLALETELDPTIAEWLAFAVQKVGELGLLRRALLEGRGAVADALEAARAALARRRSDPRTHDPAVRARVAATTPADTRRTSPFPARRLLQRAALGLPDFPTTTIGSFPQTAEVRRARAAHARGALSDAEYEAFLKAETERAIRWQEEVGLDVLVHGEFERNDMVQYFGEQLAGFAFTTRGWVQSYGSRYVRPPIIYGDVHRPKPMTVGMTAYAQSLTTKPVKGMLTGPVTMLQWSFVRDDLPRAEVCRQIALALRDEVLDLERAGIRVIQIDEPAFREGLPLRRADWSAYLAWAVECFRLASAGVRDTTQIHTHMCYSQFNDIIEAIAAMDADVISIETARSKMELIEAFVDFRYPNEIGPGVYDIHAPRIPPTEEMVALLDRAAERVPADQIWVNPDCGLKTRRWEEVKPAIAHMVEAARTLRARRAAARTG
ncbi:MAG: 5-methyltetrahydropteroyltriglutamate--homocysteine S-methyltransferase [Sphingomonadaceae bacterium]|uniref:5-methyltetrahydropteroyltriglutamate-- homocysteine S-methyltransferase n=1 Tax=Thermaurantiacus sp. TaxID=2820283 RepID=UPI00298F073B|nr:5-methyltetrahydropteroyltriglutamate--homocysteine S-methyltransferase [Thermaurantiacus sp.]MCS6986236.1 5-methyltetrahydropteroyltriglutamate--homocysteine S-methyltransferase [Sphingomonadaceae bacterium]MDW8415682.1 5-methyltetrahydropteroyltriglutamate--homocysteine S-methyltransferase [Thermaurantiacus sp.]